MKPEEMNVDDKVTDFMSFKEMREKSIHPPKDGNVDLKLGASSLIFSIATEMPLIYKMVLGNLTGLELREEEAMYDYLIKALDLTVQDIVLFGIATLHETNGDMYEDIKSNMMGRL